jgi:hypothetical protein
VERQLKTPHVDLWLYYRAVRQLTSDRLRARIIPHLSGLKMRPEVIYGKRIINNELMKALKFFSDDVREFDTKCRLYEWRNK